MRGCCAGPGLEGRGLPANGVTTHECGHTPPSPEAGQQCPELEEMLGQGWPAEEAPFGIRNWSQHSPRLLSTHRTVAPTQPPLCS